LRFSRCKSKREKHTQEDACRAAPQAGSSNVGPFAHAGSNELYDFIDTNPWALLVNSGDNGPSATNLPLLLDRSKGKHGLLVGHLATTNEHAHVLKKAQSPTLVMFEGAVCVRDQLQVHGALLWALVGGSNEPPGVASATWVEADGEPALTGLGFGRSDQSSDC
jgi:hypothetical protein